MKVVHRKLNTIFDALPNIFYTLKSNKLKYIIIIGVTKGRDDLNYCTSRETVNFKNKLLISFKIFSLPKTFLRRKTLLKN